MSVTHFVIVQWPILILNLLFSRKLTKTLWESNKRLRHYNLDLKLKEKSSEFIFKAKEMTMYYFVNERTRRISIKLNSYDNDKVLNYTFWTETQVDKIPRLLTVLKKIK